MSAHEREPSRRNTTPDDRAGLGHRGPLPLHDLPERALAEELAGRGEQGRDREPRPASDQGDDRHHRADREHSQELGCVGERFQGIGQTVDRLERPLLDRADSAARRGDRADHEERQATEKHTEIGSPSGHRSVPLALRGVH
ncbi:MAG: hypothetical protein H0X05_06700 [Actinobacteria bacterium]|nr:hypothetical protein [Actinomycetota bacterium]